MPSEILDWWDVSPGCLYWLTWIPRTESGKAVLSRENTSESLCGKGLPDVLSNRVATKKNQRRKSMTRDNGKVWVKDFRFDMCIYKKEPTRRPCWFCTFLFLPSQKINRNTYTRRSCIELIEVGDGTGVPWHIWHYSGNSRSGEGYNYANVMRSQNGCCKRNDFCSRRD